MQLKNKVLVAIMFLVFLVPATAQDKPVKQLTPAQKEKDFRYLTMLVREIYPFADLNARYKGLHNINELSGFYLGKIMKTVNNQEFIGVISEYFVELSQTGHMAYVSPESLKIWDLKEMKRTLKFRGDISAATDYWAGLLTNLYWQRYAHATIHIVYRDGKYIVNNDHLLINGRKLPAGTIVQTVEGMNPNEYIITLQNKVRLYFDSKNRRLYHPNLFAVNPEKSYEWKATFRLPDGTFISGVLPCLTGVTSNNSYVRSSITCMALTKQTAYIKIASFDPAGALNDQTTIRTFLKKTKGGFSKLIIDIRDNPGGDPGYWMDNLVAPLIKVPVIYDETAVLRRPFCDVGRKELQSYIKQYPILLSKKNHVVKVKEILDSPGYNKAEWCIFKVTRRIKPAKNYSFSGRIYLLVNENTFSAAEDFATMAKRTGFAKIVGVNTAGGAASYMASVVYILPESGILVRFEPEITLNPDGNPNEIWGTQPDIWMQRQIQESSLEKETLLQNPWIDWILRD